MNAKRKMNATVRKRPRPRTTGEGTAADSSERRVAAFEKQFFQLETRLYKLEAENARLKARIQVLEEANPHVAVRTMTSEDLRAAIARANKGRVKKGA